MWLKCSIIHCSISELDRLLVGSDGLGYKYQYEVDSDEEDPVVVDMMGLTLESEEEDVMSSESSSEEEDDGSVGGSPPPDEFKCE